MSRRVRFSDVSLPGVVAVLLVALLTQRWSIAVALLAAISVLGVIGRRKSRSERVRATTLLEPTGRLVLLYFFSPL